LAFARESHRIEHGHEVVFDDPAFVAHVSDLHVEPIFERRERTHPAGPLDQDSPRRRWDMGPCNTWPPQHQKTADDHEQHEREVREDDCLREHPIGHVTTDVGAEYAARSIDAAEA
jgi:hypothetical protein